MPSLISCLCVSKNKYSIVKNSLLSFLNQTYQNLELIFVYNDNNPDIAQIKSEFTDDRIRYYEVPIDEKNKLGYLRNYSINKANGDFVVQWDDDDIYHPDRIQNQYDFVKKHDCKVCMLDSRIVLYEDNLYLSNTWPFEGSILSEKSILKESYLNKSRGEDTDILKNFLKLNINGNNILKFLNQPSLYIYQYHGDNVFENQHFKEIINQSKLIQKHKGKEYKSYQEFLTKYGKNLNVYSQLNNVNVYFNIYQTLLKNEKKIFVLNTYGMNQPDEGLSVVFHQIKNLGLLVNDTSSIKNSIVIIAGICHMYTKHLNPNNINVIYTTYEFFPLPNLWINCLNRYYDIIIVPHPKIKELFENSGINKPIYVVQQGYPNRLLLPKVKSNNFNVGFLGVPVERKNVNLLINAIESLSIKIPNIVLKIHISKYYEGLSKIDFPKTIHFQPSYGYKSEQELAEWYASLDCYIFPSSGEGWSFTPRESLSLEIPTIISDCLVHHDLKKYSKMITLPVTAKKIRNTIKIVYDHLEEYQQLAKEGKKYVEKYNQNGKMITSIKKILDKHT